MAASCPYQDGLYAYIYTNNDWGIARNEVGADEDLVLYHGTVFFIRWIFVPYTETSTDGFYYADYISVPMQGMQSGTWQQYPYGITSGQNPNLWNLLWNNCERITAYNCNKYGLCAYDGSYYSVRSSLDVLDANGNQTGIHLTSADKVIFGYGQGFFAWYDTWNPYEGNPGNGWYHLRMYGWYDGNGIYHDLSGCFASLYLITHPNNYLINTY